MKDCYQAEAIVPVEWNKRERYVRLVSHVFADGRNVGLVRIERGLAWYCK